MSKMKPPVPGSGSYLALVHLEKMGGVATIESLMLQLLWTETPGQFQRLVIGPLDRRGLVLCRDEQLSLTAVGTKLLNPAADVSAMAAPAGSFVSPARPLTSRHRPRVAILRPGALDYRGIPSRLADQQVAFRSSITVQHEDSNG